MNNFFVLYFLNIFISLNDFLFIYQHWVTTIGVVLTLIALIASYWKMSKRIDIFRKQAISQINIATIATIKSTVNELLTINYQDNIAIFQYKVLDLNSLLVRLREQINIDDISINQYLNVATTNARLYEMQISQDIQNNKCNIKMKNFIEYLCELKDRLQLIEARMDIIIRGNKDDTSNL